MKNLGNITEITVKLESPNMDFEKLSFNQLTMLVGTNGTGKSLLMKVVWFLNMCFNSFEGLTIQQILDYTFQKPNFTGVFEGTFENGFISITMENGKITDLTINLEEDVVTSLPLYLSGNTRLFSQIETLYTLKNSISEDTFLELTPLYDIIFIMLYENKLPFTFTEHLKKTLGEFDPSFEGIESISLNEEKKFIVHYIGGESKFAHSLSNGQQSLLNIFTSQAIT